jgi:hypothetical protein
MVRLSAVERRLLKQLMAFVTATAIPSPLFQKKTTNLMPLD